MKRIKVQSWPKLITVVLLGAGMLAAGICKIAAGEWIGVAWVCLFGYLMVKGVYTYLSEAAYKRDQERGAKVRQIYRRKFGSLGPIMPWLGLVPLLICLVLALLFPTWEPLLYVFLGTLVLLLVYNLCLKVWLEDQLDRESEAPSAGGDAA